MSRKLVVGVDAEARPPLFGVPAATSAPGGPRGAFCGGRLMEAGGLTTTCPKKDTSFGEWALLFGPDLLPASLPPEEGGGLLTEGAFVPRPPVLRGSDPRGNALVDLLTAAGVSHASLPSALFLFLLLEGGDVSESSAVSVAFPGSAPVDGDPLRDAEEEELLLLNSGDVLDALDASLPR